ncbi:endospore germination permease [Clostridium sp. DJ247]|uniref:GerAB/ArcD/ProY family transporter n=1 Tax=Clostridium sp. DJ247 TaxID=2726188 RepID=UPI0016268A61|nr:endospore germination permease [Clostridium sp. DJ247]MBC2579445.1 endospore germination permease [Clostridium sp. DJ247]
MEKISTYQLYAITVLFQIGTTIVFGFASTAGRDAWIVILISTTTGIILNLLYTLLMRMNSGLTLVEACILRFGKWLGPTIAWTYTIANIYNMGRTLGDLRFLIPVTILPRTSILIILAIFMFVEAYAVFSGIEVIARLGELFLPLILLLFFIEVILIFSSDIISIHNLQPIVGKGWKPIWKALWPVGISVGFGESIIFSMIWPLVNQPKKILKTTILATITSGLLITAFDILAIGVLGEGIFKNSIYPLYTVVQQISVSEFIENLQAIAVLYFLTTSFLKISIYFFAIVRAIQQLTAVANGRIFILPVLIIVLYLGVTMSSSVSSHIQSGLRIHPNLIPIMIYFVLPAILFMVTLIKKILKIKKKQLKN